MGIIEVVVALAVLALVVTPLTRLVVTTTSGTNQLHLRSEAIDLASQDLETVQYQLNQGQTPTLGKTTTTVTSGGAKFTVVTDFEELSGGGSGTTLCTSGSASNASSTKIGQITATVEWPSANGSSQGTGQQVVERTLYAPAEENLDASLNGEIAVPVGLANGTSDTTQPIQFQVTADACTAKSCSAIPAGDTTSGTANTGSTGCAVFTNLDPDFTYNVTAVSNAGYVDDNQNSDAATASGDPKLTNVAVSPGSVSVTPTFLIDQGANVTINFQAYAFGGTTKSAAAMPTVLPISVAQTNSPTSTNTTTMLGGSGAFATASGAAQSALLFPATTTSIWAGAADAQSGGGAVSPALSQGSSATITLPLYALTLSTSLGDLQLSDGTETIPLGSPSGGNVTLAVPAGSYALTYTNGSAVTSPKYITVTSRGTCSGTSAIPVGTCDTGSPSTAAVPVQP